jgi:hypothetical protein
MPALTFDDRLRRLLGAGYFPSEPPPPFTTSEFAVKAGQIVAQIDEAATIGLWTSPESFSIPRWGQARRKLSIVNPINQLMVSKIVAEHWDEISKILQNSKISEFHPEIVATGGPLDSGAKCNGVKRSGFERPCQAWRARPGMAS